MRDIVDAQPPNGVFPSYAPYPYQHEWNFASGWCDAPVIIAYTLWQVYGDTSFFEDAWPALTRLMGWREKENTNFIGIAHGNLWGDWLALGEETPPEFIDSVEYAKCARMMSEMAAELSRRGSLLAAHDQSAHYELLSKHIRAAFQSRYLKAGRNLTVETETAYALTLANHVAPPEQRDALGKCLADRIHTKGNRLTTGLFGTEALLAALTEGSQNELALQLLQRREFPGLGYEVEQGATTIWERWDSYRKELGLGGGTNAPMNSLNHFALGSVGEWLISTLAGISSEGAGFNKIFISPNPPAFGTKAEPAPITWVKAKYFSVHGEIATAWTNSATNFVLETDIPANTTATVFVRGRYATWQVSSGSDSGQDKAVKVLHRGPGSATFSVLSGHYRFVSSE
jgi:alpha-L-rhamnosidase